MTLADSIFTMRSTKNKILCALPVFRKSLMMAAQVNVLPVPVAISNKKRFLPLFADFYTAFIALIW